MAPDGQTKNQPPEVGSYARCIYMAYISKMYRFQLDSHIMDVQAVLAGSGILICATNEKSSLTWLRPV